MSVMRLTYIWWGAGVGGGGGREGGREEGRGRQLPRTLVEDLSTSRQQREI